MTDQWIDPIQLRPAQPEGFSVRSFLLNLISVSCSNVPKDQMFSGGDVSKWQGVMDWNKFFDNGMGFAVIRAMINGYIDEQFERNAQILTDQKRKFLVYGATGYPTLSNAIPYARALANFIQGIPYLAIWWDAEAWGNLNPRDAALYTETVLGELEVLLPDSILEIYTRQSVWDDYVEARAWDKYPLAAARYNTSLTCPWSDNLYQFRDWDTWRYWQDSQWWDGKKFGAQSTYIDHDYFNGTEVMFDETYTIKVADPLEERVEKLEQEMIVVQTRLDSLEAQAHTHDSTEEVNYFEVTALENVPVGIAVGHDKACEGKTPVGKPIIEHPGMSERIVYSKGDKIKVYKKASYSCKDDVDTPTIKASGNVLYYVVVEGYKDTVSFIKADQVTK